MSQVETVTVDARRVSESVVEAVAEAKGVDSLDLPPLYGVLDTDALDRIFEPAPSAARREGQVTFRYAGCDVTVSGDSSVTAEERTE